MLRPGSRVNAIAQSCMISAAAHALFLAPMQQGNGPHLLHSFRIAVNRLQGFSQAGPPSLHLPSAFSWIQGGCPFICNPSACLTCDPGMSPVRQTSQISISLRSIAVMHLSLSDLATRLSLSLAALEKLCSHSEVLADLDVVDTLMEDTDPIRTAAKIIHDLVSSTHNNWCSLPPGAWD